MEASAEEQLLAKDRSTSEHEQDDSDAVCRGTVYLYLSIGRHVLRIMSEDEGLNAGCLFLFCSAASRVVLSRV